MHATFWLSRHYLSPAAKAALVLAEGCSARYKTKRPCLCFPHLGPLEFFRNRRISPCRRKSIIRPSGNSGLFIPSLPLRCPYLPHYTINGIQAEGKKVKIVPSNIAELLTPVALAYWNFNIESARKTHNAAKEQYIIGYLSEKLLSFRISSLLICPTCFNEISGWTFLYSSSGFSPLALATDGHRSKAAGLQKQPSPPGPKGREALVVNTVRVQIPLASTPYTTLDLL
ncbi:7889_t:CDS:2, partial [Funneliformis caledonium]